MDEVPNLTTIIYEVCSIERLKYQELQIEPEKSNLKITGSQASVDYDLQEENVPRPQVFRKSKRIWSAS
jgi:hypothetical protein